MKILGIETSCDETAVSVVKAEGDLLARQSLGGVGDSLSFEILGSAVNSQVKIHEQYGGVFPTLAKREHQKNLPLVFRQALTNAKIKESEIEIIAVTVGPGLEPALWTGINFAENLSKKMNIPLVPTNHMVGHIASVLFNKPEEFSIFNFQFSKKKQEKIEFPAIALLISGGHTELVYLKNWGAMEKIGETQDDAVGEAFDKVARMLGLLYPGGPEISRLAETARGENIQLETKFPRPMIHSKDFNFSFSGLKTAVLYYIKKIGTLGEKEKMEIAREFEDAVIETLLSKTKKAIEKYFPRTLVIGGGVIANKALRENFIELEKKYPEVKVLIPEKSLTTDNATMIAAAGYIEKLKTPELNRELRAQGNLEIK